MSWIGQNQCFSQIAEAEADADAAASRAGFANKEARHWKAQAEQWQKAFEQLRLVVIDKSGALAAQAALKEEAIAQIQKFDPSNKLLDSDYRKQVYDEVKTRTENEILQKPKNAGPGM